METSQSRLAEVMETDIWIHFDTLTSLTSRIYKLAGPHLTFSVIVLL